MDINFEAANMAGYNNPRIEVFKAILSSSGSDLDRYPAKSVILNCISRGSIPVIMLRFSTAGYLMHLSEWETTEIGSAVIFSTLAGDSSSTKIQIRYPEDDNPPSVTIE